MNSTLPPDLSDSFFQYDTTDPGSITQLPCNPADEPADPKIQMLPRGASAADAAPVGDGTTSITYLPFAGNAAGLTDSSALNDKLQIEVASSFADVNKDVTVALLAMKTALLKVIEGAGEQDRIDALHREASRRACL